MGIIKRKRQRIDLGLMALEPRWMFDGAAAVDAAHAAPDASAKALIPEVPAPVQVRAADPAQDSGKKEVVFVDTSLLNYQTLEAAVKPGVEIEEIGGGQSGLAQMAKWAETHTGYDSISLLSHGSEASIQVGTDVVTDASLSDATIQAELAEIGSALKAGGDLLVYGCDVAKGADGRQFVNDLAAATGANVAASTDVTGKDGNWVLEYSSGVTVAADSFDASGLSAYNSDLVNGTLFKGLFDANTSNDFTAATSINVDANGNFYLTGNFYGTVDFDPGTGVLSKTSVAFKQNSFVEKLDSSGNVVWVSTFGGSCTSSAYGAAIDGTGNVYVVGQYKSGAFNPGSGVTLTSNSKYSTYLLELN